MDLNEVFTRHRGPYRLMAVREFTKKKGFIRAEWLKGELAADEVVSEALALLADPRDRIEFINVWSVREEQFVLTVRKPVVEEVENAA